MYSPEMQTKIQSWRSKSLEGKLTQQECREIVAAMREARGRTAQPQAGSATTGAAKTRAARTAAAASKPRLNGDDLLSELE